MDLKKKESLLEFFKRLRKVWDKKGICKECGSFQTHRLQRCKCGGEFEFPETFTVYQIIYKNIHTYSNNPMKRSKGFWFELWKRKLKEETGYDYNEKQFYEVFEQI